jgi:hypothetical protein
MGRSIHVTRRALARARQEDWSDVDRLRARVCELEDQLYTKRRIKRLVQQERGRPTVEGLPLSPDIVPILVCDEGPFVHFPATQDDIRGVLRLLPPGTLDGLSAIELELGAGDQDTQDEASGSAEPDPFIGRRGHELLSGVFAGDLLGYYSYDQARIHLFGYVYDNTAPYLDIWTIYLRLSMLSTLVHEVAHHHDHTQRVARGRWRADREETAETYAQRMQHQWVHEVVACYLEATYPAEVQRLRDWIADYGGAVPSLAALAGEPRVTAKGGAYQIRGLFSLSGAILPLVQAVARGAPRHVTRLDFARALDHADLWAEALVSTERVLAEAPADSAALALQAHIHIHLAETDPAHYESARDLALRVVASNDAPVRDQDSAWLTLTDAYEGLADWPGVVYAATQSLASWWHLPRWWRAPRAIEQRIRARMRLGDYTGAEADLGEMARRCERSADKQAIAALRAELATFASAPGGSAPAAARAEGP